MNGRAKASDGVKGILFGARMKYLSAQGAAKRDQVLAHLSQGDRETLTGALLPNTWYPADLLVRLDRVIADTLVQGDRRELFKEMGRFSADVNLRPGGVQRSYLKEGDAQVFLRHVPRMYTTVHGVDGRRIYERMGDSSAVIRSLPGGEVSVDECLTTVGWLERGIELSGGRDVRVTETQCLAKGAPCCEYRCEWR